MIKRLLIITMIVGVSIFYLGPRPGWAGKSDNSLNFAVDTLPENADAYFNVDRIGIVLARCIWDSLLYLDPQTYEYKPLLATSYKWVDNQTIDFLLREGIRFHNGEVFDSDDVVYTLNFVSNPQNGAKNQNNVNWIDRAEKLGKYAVRVHLKHVFPAALEYLSGSLPIYPNEYYAKVGPSGMGLKPVGTGPYRVEEIEPGKKIVMTRNAEYFAGSPKGIPSIAKIVGRAIPEVNTQVVELMSGKLDWLWRLDADQAENLRRVSKVKVLTGNTMRIGYLQFDAANKTNTNPPTTNVLVRKAIAHAIDRQTIVDRLVRGESQVIHSACFPTQFGCTQDVVKYEYNPKKAIELLRQAGFENGFKIDLYAYRDRPLVEAIIGYLKEVGIDAEIRFQKYAAVRDGVRNGKIAFDFLTWGSFSINDVSAITSVFFKGGQDDTYQDKQVAAWLDIADSSIDQGIRKSNYKKALQRIAEQAYWVPLWSYCSNYAVAKDLDFRPSPDEITRFFLCRWK